MTLMARIPHDLTDRERVIVWLLRHYVSRRTMERTPLPSLIELGSQLGVCSFAVIALASVFQLSESCLHRNFVTHDFCAEELSSDERAILLLIETEAASSFRDSTMPPGLPGALFASLHSVKHLIMRNECSPDRSLDAR
jgi:hypothetical protein